MEALIDILEEYKDLKVRLIFEELIDSNMKELVIELNQTQLFELGEDSTGRRLWSFSPSQPYSPYTMQIKQAKGQPTDRLTLKDTGRFYESFKVVVGSDEFIIDANGQKSDTNLFDEYGDDILGLNKFSMDEFLEKLLTTTRFYLREKI